MGTERHTIIIELTTGKTLITDVYDKSLYDVHKFLNEQMKKDFLEVYGEEYLLIKTANIAGIKVIKRGKK